MKGFRGACGALGYLAHSLDVVELGEFWSDTCHFGDVIDVLKKNMTGTFFDTVQVVEWRMY